MEKRNQFSMPNVQEMIYLGKKEEIFAYCLKRNEKVTAKEILDALYPDKQQPYINSVINELVYEKKLVRIDTRPYTVHVPREGEIVGPVTDYSRGSIHRKNVSKHINAPCAEEVEKYLESWKLLENYRLQEDALDKLFLCTYPKNENIEDILVKVATLNDFYSTQIFSVYPVAKHILNLQIDDRLQAGDLSVVNDIAVVKMEDGTRKNFYSFATKYCSHHQPEKFAIYDSYVEKVLKHYRNIDRFSVFNDMELKSYEVFNRVLRDFQRYYYLDAYTLKQLDRYLWLLGKEAFPKKYYK